jgi:hypothetical protein
MAMAWTEQDCSVRRRNLISPIERASALFVYCCRSQQLHGIFDLHIAQRWRVLEVEIF